MFWLDLCFFVSNQLKFLNALLIHQTNNIDLVDNVAIITKLLESVWKIGNSLTILCSALWRSMADKFIHFYYLSHWEIPLWIICLSSLYLAWFSFLLNKYEKNTSPRNILKDETFRSDIKKNSHDENINDVIAHISIKLTIWNVALKKTLQINWEIIKEIRSFLLGFF